MRVIDLSQEEQKRCYQLMGDVRLLKGLKAEFREKLFHAGEAQAFEAGEVIVSEGGLSDAFYLILQGNAEVSSQDRGEFIHLTHMGPASTFGDIGLLLDTARTATVKAIDEVTVLRFGVDVFRSLFEKIPAFGHAVASGLAARLRKVSGQISMPEHEGPLPDATAGGLLPVPFIMRHRVLPLERKDGVLMMGFVEDPTPAVVKAIHNYIPSVKLKSVRIHLDTFNKTMSQRLGFEEEQHIEGGTLELDRILERGVAEGISDLHLPAGKRPYWRIDGDIVALEDSPHIGRKTLWDTFLPHLEKRHVTEFETYGDTDFSYSLGKHARFRVNLYSESHGISASMRLIPNNISVLEDLGLPKVVDGFCKMPSGLVVVTGPTGSGKSTTLAAMIDRVNQTRRSHIITLEDPIEFLHENKCSVVNQREIGGHVPSFERAIRSSLREDPDVILIGETRDAETLRMALEVANTGHLAFATLHTNSALSTVNRIVDMFPAENQNQVRNTMASVLRGVICQSLCKRIGGGRVAAFEVLVMNLAIGNLIREGKVQQIMNAIQAGKAEGHQLLNDHLAKLVGDGLVDKEEALSKTYDRRSLESRLK